jgi:hypothetical protein
MKHAFSIIYNVLKRTFCDASHLKAVLKPHRLTKGYYFPALVRAIPRIGSTVDLVQDLVPRNFCTVVPRDFRRVDWVRDSVSSDLCMVVPMDLRTVDLARDSVPKGGWVQVMAPMGDWVQVMAPMDGLVPVVAPKAAPRKKSFAWKATHARLPPPPIPQSQRKNYRVQRVHCQLPAVVPLLKYHP